MDGNTQWFIVVTTCGGGYDTYVVDGWEALEKRFLELYLGEPLKLCEYTPEQITEMETLLRDLREDANWTHGPDNEKAAYGLEEEDASVDIFRVTSIKVRTKKETNKPMMTPARLAGMRQMAGNLMYEKQTSRALNVVELCDEVERLQRELK